MANLNRLQSAGPIDPDTGFPLWFSDGATRLEIVLNADDPFAPAIEELPNPALPRVFPDNFPGESFYYMAEAQLTVGGMGIRGRARVIMALEAAFGGAGEPALGANVVFARIRVRMDDLIPGAKYSIIHPYGEFIDLEADDKGRVFHTADLGISQGDPYAVMATGEVAPFLIGTSAVPAGYIGDGVSEQQVTGGPFRNHVVITGTRIREEGGAPDPTAPADINRVFTDLFTVQGRIATRVGARPTSATYEVSGGQTRLRVSAESDVGQDIRLVGDPFHFKLEGNGTQYSVIGDVAAVPDGGFLINVTDNPPTRTALPVNAAGKICDLVTIASATHDRDTDTLSIDARSSDPGALLTLEPLGTALLHGPNAIAATPVAPGVIKVVSNKGGVARAEVQLLGIAAPQEPVEAHIGANFVTFADEVLSLNGSGSPGATSYSWAQQSGPAPAANILTPNAAKTDVHFNTHGNYVFELTVTGNGGPATEIYDVAVAAPPATDNLTITLCEYRTGRQQFRIVGTVGVRPNEIIVKRGGNTLGSAAADPLGDFAVRASLGDVGGAPPLPGETLEIASKRSTINFPISIRN